MEQVSLNNPNKKYSRYYTYVRPIVSDPIITGYFGLVATLILCAFFIVFAISPTVSTILGLTKKIEEQKQLIKTMDSKINSLITAQENYSQIEPYLPQLSTAFPQVPLPENIIAGVVESASSSGVTLSSLQISHADLTGESPPKEGGPVIAPSKDNVAGSLNIPSTGFAVSIQSSSENIRQFASDLQNLPRIITLSSMSVTADQTQAGTNQNKMSADMSGFSYYLK